MKLFYKTVFSISIFFSFTCTDEITFNLKFEPKILIYGDLINNTDNIFIRIQRTIPVNDSITSNNSAIVENPTITLFTKDSNGTDSMVTSDFTLMQDENGNGDKFQYRNTKSINPTIGNYYWIEVIADGNIYKSSEELLRNPIKISNVATVGDKTKVFFKDPKNEINHYLLNYTTVKVISYFIDSKTRDTIFLDAPEIIYTQETETSNDVLFNGNENAFIEIDNSIQFDTLKLNFGQLSYNTYQFYQNLLVQREANKEAEASEEDGGGGAFPLFSPPPTHLIGNIINTKTQEPVLGNFGVLSTLDTIINIKR